MIDDISTIKMRLLKIDGKFFTLNRQNVTNANLFFLRKFQQITIITTGYGSFLNLALSVHLVNWL